MCAQAGHSVEGALEQLAQSFDGRIKIDEWKRKHKHTKICVSVDSEEELLKVHMDACRAGIISYLVLDAGITEFNQPTHTCCCLGPDENGRIDAITGNLKLL